MKTDVIKIGNSKGLRLSKMILKKYNIQDKVEIVLEKDHLKIIPASNPREGWSEQFKEMAMNQDDLELIPDVFEDEDLPEWK